MLLPPASTRASPLPLLLLLRRRRRRRRGFDSGSLGADPGPGAMKVTVCFGRTRGGGAVRGREHQGAHAHPAGGHALQEGDRQGKCRPQLLLRLLLFWKQCWRRRRRRRRRKGGRAGAINMAQTLQPLQSRGKPEPRLCVLRAVCSEFARGTCTLRVVPVRHCCCCLQRRKNAHRHCCSCAREPPLEKLPPGLQRRAARPPRAGTGEKARNTEK